MTRVHRWILLALLSWVPIGIGFALWIPHLGGQPIDLIVPTADVLAQLGRMSAEQKASHFWMTLTLDTLFPLAFGAVFVLTALSCWGRWGRLGAAICAIPPLLDLVENMTELLALKGNTMLLPVKEVVSPIKYHSIQIAALVVLATWIIVGVRKLVRRS